MEKEKIVIEQVDDIGGYPDRESYIIIQHPTGVVYTMQCNGMRCEQETVEGFVKCIGEMDDFDDCMYGCTALPYDPAARDRLARDLDLYFYKNHYSRYLTFDFARTDILKEGFWPVKYKLQGKWHNAILHNGNCD